VTDIVVHDKVKNEIIIVEVGITSQDQLQTVEAENMRKYDMLAKELQMKNCNHSLCSDLGWYSDKQPQKVSKETWSG
jgi:hypothetical protein